MTLKFEYLPNKKLCRLSGDNFDGIRAHFSVKNENAFFIKRSGRFAPDRFYCITPTGIFEPGMFFDIIKYVNGIYPDAIINISDDLKYILTPEIKDATLYDSLKIPLRDYQIETVNRALKCGRGIIKLGTGGGKTLTIASLISSIHATYKRNFKCLIIVPDLTLVDQTYNDFVSNYNVPFKCTRWSGNLDPDFTSDVIIANMGILQSRFEEEPWLLDVDVLVVDECHKLKKNNVICKMVNSIKTLHKFGLTGTLPDSKVDEWNIKGKLGNIIYEKNSFELRSENYLTNVDIKIIELAYNSKPIRIPGMNKFWCELDFIYKNEFRNNTIKSIISRYTKNILILVNHIAHGEILYKKYYNEFPGRVVYFIRGEVEVTERSRVIKEMEDNDNVICIAISAIFSTGVNIKNLHTIVFASGGKSFIRTIQSIGRGLRLNPNKNILNIIDIADSLPYSKEHGKLRKGIYTTEKIQFKSGKLVEPTLG